MNNKELKLAKTKALKPEKLSKKFQKTLKDSDNEFKHVLFIKTSDDYFALPKEKRERYGFWYKKPAALPSKIFGDEEEGGWEDWKKQIQKEYPIQGWFREWFLSWDNPLYAFVQHRHKEIADTWYELKCFFKPKHEIIRKAIPNTWVDISGLIIDVNFAMIKDFYYGEVVNGHVDWMSCPAHKKFYLWIKRAIKYIEKDRPKLQKEIEGAYPKFHRKGSYKELYGKVDRLETLLWAKDTNLLKQMLDQRDYFWT